MPALRKILNLVDDVSSVNYGIWHAAMATASELHENHGIESWLLSRNFDASFREEDFPLLKTRKLDSLNEKAAEKLFAEFNPEECIVASHGCWQFPTRWGAIALKMGFRWVYTPHGMLEPWSMRQKIWKKLPYFYLVEKRLAAKSSLVRAVGKPEWENLLQHFPSALLIPNGIYKRNLVLSENRTRQASFLFLARLHHKKNVIPLAKAWLRISTGLRKDFKLRIAGTDDGEKEKLLHFMDQHPDSGIEFLGPVFGQAKEKLLAECRFYILPSQSEGFPTSVVEAAGAGLLPLISRGCNFPELLEAGGGMDCGMDEDSIQIALEKAMYLSESETDEMQARAQQLIAEKYLWEQIAGGQADAYSRLAYPKKI
jgi:glycosyltransferase involved in cell wall biosynthesis